jgi:hypothetical protein
MNGVIWYPYILKTLREKLRQQLKIVGTVNNERTEEEDPGI